MSNLQKYPSMTSMYSMASIGALPPGMGYLARKQKPDKPYGLSFVTRLNRTHRGPGEKYLWYALGFFVAAMLCFLGGGLYVGHRNVSRMNVYRTEVLGALMIVAGMVCISLMGRLLFRARLESNKWRAGVRFRPEGLYTVVAVNETYVPQDQTQLATGTYGPKALKVIPKPGVKGKGKKKGRSRTGSKSSLATGRYDKRNQGQSGYLTPDYGLDTPDRRAPPPIGFEGLGAPPPIGFEGGLETRAPPPIGFEGGFETRAPPPIGFEGLAAASPSEIPLMYSEDGGMPYGYGPPYDYRDEPHLGGPNPGFVVEPYNGEPQFRPIALGADISELPDPRLDPQGRRVILSTSSARGVTESEL